MTKTIEIQWDEDVTVLGEHCPADKLERAKYAQFLTGFLAGQGFDGTKPEGEQKKNYVLNLNSEWGSGKTYFLKRWYHDLKQHYPVVYVDAWKQDYSDDPLMTVISSMIKQLREQAGKSADDPKFKVPRKAIGLLKAAMPSAAGALAKRYLGIDPVAIMEASDEGDVGEKITDEEGNEIDMGAAASKAVQYLLDEHDAKSDAIVSLKKSVEQWIQAVVGLEKKQYPAFIFIDELDRCRPSYAVEMLETIKHIFDIPGVVFVVGTDTEQLQHAVKAIYGDGFDARTYLGRFFNSRNTLQKPSFSSFLNTHCDMHKLTDEYFVSHNIQIWPKTIDTPTNLESNDKIARFQTIIAIYECFDLSPRQAIQTTHRLIAIISSMREDIVLNIPFLVILLCLKEKYVTFYNELLHEKLFNERSSERSADSLFKQLKLRNEYLYLFIDPKEPIVKDKNFTPISHGFQSGFYKCSFHEFLTLSTEVLRVSPPNIANTLTNYLEQSKRESTSSAPRFSHGKIWGSISLLKALKEEPSSRNISLYQSLVELSSSLESTQSN